MSELDRVLDLEDFIEMLKNVGIEVHDLLMLFTLLAMDDDELVDFADICEGMHKLIGNGLSLEIAMVQLRQLFVLKTLEASGSK